MAFPLAIAAIVATDDVERKQIRTTQILTRHLGARQDAAYEVDSDCFDSDLSTTRRPHLGQSKMK